MPSPALARGRWPALGATVAALGLSVAVLAAPGRFGELASAAIWGLAILFSFTGWGGWIARRLVPELDVDWGLRAAWGLAVTLAAGGLLCFCGLARRPVLLIWIFAGMVLAGRQMWDSQWPLRKGRRPWTELPLGWEAALVAALVGIALYLYVGSAARSMPNPSDDWPAYLPFIRRLLQSGRFIDPFSVRRMASYGGQTYLQALVLMVASNAQIQLFDGGICLLLVLGLVLGFAREARQVSWMVLILTCLLVLMLPDNRVNSASEISGVVGFLAAYRTMALVDRHGRRGPRAALLIALPIAAVATLRQNYLAVVVFLLGALALRGAAEGESWPARRRHLGQVALWVAAFLLPWAALAFRSNHTFLFPIFHGNYNPAYEGLTAPSTWDARVRFYISAAFHSEPIRTMPLLLLAAPAIAAGAHRRPLMGLWAGTIVGFAMLTLNLPDAEIFSIARYDVAYVVAFVIATGLTAAEELPQAVSTRNLTTFALVVAGLALQIYGSDSAMVRTLTVPLDRMSAMVGAGPSPLDASPDDERRMQQSVPPGERLLVMIERPYLLDFSRNRVELLDQPGAVSPPPGLPLGKDGEKVAGYLMMQGLRYVAFTRPDRPKNDLYSRAHWKANLSSPTRIWRITAPVYLSAFDAVDALARIRKRLYDDGHLVVVDLALRG